MIDDKIEEAARLDDKEYYDSLSDNDRCFFEYGFRRGYNRALKDLWHPASEEPKKVKNLLLETTYEYGKPIYHLIKYMPNGNNVCAWREWYKGAHISRWLYIDDLLPKEGGSQ